MKKIFAAAALVVCVASPAQSFPPIGPDGEAFVAFRTVNGSCIPESLLTQLSDAGAQINRETRDGRKCCPSAARHVSPRLVDPALWRQVQPFAAARSSSGPDFDALCRAEPMTEAQAQKLRAQVDAGHQAAQKKQREDNQRPVPASWAALKQSAHPADVTLAKSIESMEWWTACVAWGKEARAKALGRRGTALEQYLRSEKIINTTDLSNVRSSGPVIGQTGCGAFSILGLPSKSNTTETGSGVRIQHVYRDRGIYVYVAGPRGDHNGVVTSTQY